MYFQLTTPQQNIWNLQKFYEDSNISNICGAIFYDKKLESDILSQAINKEIELQAGLRLQFREVNGEPMQCVADYSYQNIPLRCFNTKEEYLVFADDFARKPINLTSEKMYEFCIVHVENKSGFIVKASHLISDAWTFSLFARNITEHYYRLVNGEQPSEIQFSYIDYIKTEQQYLESEKYVKDKAFWSEKYSAVPEKAIIKHSSATISDLKADRISHQLSVAETKAIDDFCGKIGISQAVFFESAVIAYLARINEENSSVTIGVPVLNRNTKKEKSTVGMYISTMPLTIPVCKEMSVTELCNGITSTHREIFRHQKYPYQKILQAIREKHSFQGSLFDVMVSYQNAKTDTIGKTEWYSNGYSETPVELHIDNRDSTDSYTITVDYQVELFRQPEEIYLLIERLLSIITQIISNPDCPVSALDILTETEHQRVIYGFNDTAVEYPRDKCVHELFSQQAARTPDKIALVFEDKQFTYKQLDEMSNSLAHYLREKGVKPNDIVPIISQRSYLAIVAMFAVLKAGGAYMPVDPTYPKDRIDYMINDAGSTIALTCGYCEALPVMAINLDTYNFEENTNQLNNVNKPDDLCYLIFTSGSTGKPKGAMLKHSSLVNFLSNNEANEFQSDVIRNCNCVLAIGAFIFDISLVEIFIPLLNGLSIVVANGSVSNDPELLSQIIKEYKIDFICATPTRLSYYLNSSSFSAAMSGLKTILTAGESFTPELLEKIRTFTNAKIYNGYGPTETTVGCSFSLVENTSDITIGKPIANTQIYILDKDRKPLPIGVAGELCISGDGVGKGYLNRPELTAEKFIPNPFIEGKTMYCTGDLARWRADGEIEYLGRIDTQVKIRGLRIELGEIESVMGGFEGIHMTAVTDKRDENNRQYLVGYYTADVDIDEKALRQHLSAKLPKYMVPNYFVRLAEMPMTASGKTDRKNLPLPDFSVSQEEYVAPETECEKQLCSVLSTLFSMERVGVTDEFFNDLGGDSLRAIEYVANAHVAGVEFALQNVFDYPTVRELCNFLENGAEKTVRYTTADFEKYEEILSRNVIDESFVPKKKPLGNVLLTGATGFLGAHILDALMQNETGKIYCLVRSNSPDDRRGRWPEIIKYYFGDKYDSEIGKRIIPIVGDITNTLLSPDAPEDVQTVIHTVATVKHFGTYDYFRSVNVEGTRNVVNYTKRIGAKMIHISTISVSGNSLADEFEVYRSAEEKNFYETSLFIGQPLENVYVRSKFEAEMEVLNAILDGLDAKIVRVGNLTNRLSDSKFQPNYKSNAFLSRFKAAMDLGLCPDYILPIYAEFSPIDQTAEGVVKIAQNVDKQCVFHLNSNRPIYFDRLLEVLNQLGIKMEIVSGKVFNDTLQRIAKDSKSEYIYEAFQNDMDENGQLVYDSNIRIKNDFTDWFMRKVGFEWAQIDFEYIKGYVDYFRKLGYFEV